MGLYLFYFHKTGKLKNTPFGGNIFFSTSIFLSKYFIEHLNNKWKQCISCSGHAIFGNVFEGAFLRWFWAGKAWTEWCLVAFIWGCQINWKELESSFDASLVQMHIWSLNVSSYAKWRKNPIFQSQRCTGMKYNKIDFKPDALLDKDLKLLWYNQEISNSCF